MDLRNQIVDQSLSLHELLTSEKNLPFLPEKMFRENFLPFFSGAIPIDKNEDVLKVWFTISGSPMGKVNIIDNSKKILFTVPGIFDNSIIDIKNKKESGMKFSEIITFAKMWGGISPAKEQNIIKNKSYEKLRNKLQQSELYTEQVRMWNIIFKYYNITQDAVENKENDKTVELNNNDAKSSNVSDDDFE